MTELDERLAVVASARRWLGTPYRHRASLLGVGVDCAQIIHEAFTDAGLEARIDLGRYNADWMLHRGEEKYLAVVEQYMTRVDGEDDIPLIDRPPNFRCDIADVLVFKLGRTFCHGAIVTGWPRIIHSYLPARMVEEVDITGTPMAHKPMRVYSYWGTTQ